MNIQNANGLTGISNDRLTLKNSAEQAKPENIVGGISSPSYQVTQVTISEKARALLSQESGTDGSVEPLTAGGTTLPPWPPTKQL